MRRPSEHAQDAAARVVVIERGQRTASIEDRIAGLQDLLHRVALGVERLDKAVDALRLDVEALKRGPR